MAGLLVAACSGGTTGTLTDGLFDDDGNGQPPPPEDDNPFNIGPGPGPVTTTQQGPTSSGQTAVVSSSTGGGGCTQICTELFNCGLDMMRCPGFTPTALQLFLNGTMNDGCMAECMANPGALDALVDPTNCAQTVTSVRAVSTSFACACDNGPGDPLCVGAGGAGGN